MVDASFKRDCLTTWCEHALKPLPQRKDYPLSATINQRTYETKRPVEESYESEKSKRVVFDDKLPR